MVTSHINVSEQMEARDRGFPIRWLVHSEYRIEEGKIRPSLNGQWLDVFNSSGARTYFPMADHPAMLSEFGKAASGAPADVLRFVHQFGLPGLWRTYHFNEAPEHLRFLEAAGVVAIEGDPLSWVVHHARAVRLVLSLLNALEHPAPLQRELEQYRVQSEDGSTRLAFPSAQRGNIFPFSYSVEDTTTPREVALRVIARVLSRNIEGVRRALVVEPNESGHLELQNQWQPNNLLDCIYWKLADVAMGGTVRHCADPQCGALFVATSDKMKFCPPPVGNKGVSPCMNRFKQQRHREKVAAKRAASKRRARKASQPQKGKGSR
ncbi:MAG: hypothetical protein AB7H96_24760 [Vicinamibacterales bacterium]